MTQGTSLAVQWLRICLAMQRTWVQSPVGEVRSYMLQGKEAQGKEAHVLWGATKEPMCCK